MKALKIILLLFLPFLVRAQQSPVYFFNTVTDTAVENNSSVLVGYVKSSMTSTTFDSVNVYLKSGSPRASHMDTTSKYTLYFNVGVDSVPFFIQIMKDTFPEYPEQIQYVLRAPNTSDTIGSDSILTFILRDPTPPAIITYIVDSAWCYESNDSFNAGVYVPFGNICYLGISINNPNPFYVRYFADNIGCANNAGYPSANACSYSDYYYNPETCYAPPGISVHYKGVYLTNENSTSDKYFYCRISNLDANIIQDSLVFFTIRHVNFYDPPLVSFDASHLTVSGDSSFSIGIPITIRNNNMQPHYFRVDTFNVRSNLPGPDFTMSNPYFGYGNGTTYDTLWVTLLNRHLINDTINADFVIRGVTGNLSPDTLFHLTIIDTGTLIVSFKGAGFAHLKDDGIGYVQVYTNSPVTYPVSVYVSYLNGDAVAGVDFLWRDTTVIFPPYLYDTIALPVVMLKNHIHDGNKQVNLQLSDVSPSFVQYDIRQYTYTIIDNDSTATYPAGVTYLNEDPINIYPNPFSSDFTIHTSAVDYKIAITNLLGAEFYTAQNLSGDMQINLSDLPLGSYLIRISSGDSSIVKMITKI